MAVTMTQEKIYEAFLGKMHEEKTFYYGHSYTANPIACAAALASLEIFETELVLKTLASKIAHFSRSLTRLQELPHVGEIRQCGLIAGIEIMEDARANIPYPKQAYMGAKVCMAARAHGLLTRPILDTIVLMPPLCASEEEIDQAVEALCKSLEA